MSKKFFLVNEPILFLMRLNICKWHQRNLVELAPIILGVTETEVIQSCFFHTCLYSVVVALLHLCRSSFSATKFNFLICVNF